MRVLAGLVLVAVMLAGCAKEDSPPADVGDQVLDDPDTYYANHFCVQQDIEPRVLAPDAEGTPWRFGDWWEYTLRVDGEDLGRTKLIYYGDQDFDSTGTAQHYMVGTPTREEALHHAVFSTNPVIGRVHALLYSPHESGAHADMFNFPLCAGNTWTTHFFATTFHYETKAASLSIPGGSDAGFRLVGTSDDGSTIEHTFSPTTKWFTKIDLDRADGTTVDMQLVAYGDGETGDAYFLRGQKDSVLGPADLANGPVTVDREAGGDGAYDTLGVYLELQRQSTQRRIDLEVLDPDGDVAACVGVGGSNALNGGATDCDASPLLVEVPWEEGDWTVRVVQAQGVGPVDYDGQIRLVSIYDRSGGV